MELTHGLLTSATDPNTSAFWFKRELENVVIGEPIARDYMDLRRESDVTDREKANKLKVLKEEQLALVVRHCNFFPPDTFKRVEIC